MPVLYPKHRLPKILVLGVVLKRQGRSWGVARWMLLWKVEFLNLSTVDVLGQ